MAASDSSLPVSVIDIASMTLTDGGSNSLTLGLVPGGTFEYTVETPPYVEVMHQMQHVSGGPVLRKTGSGNVTGKLTSYVTSMYGSSNETPYEVFTRTGTAASWGTTGTGDKSATRLAVVNTTPGGASQTTTFAYCVFTNVAISYQDGIMIVTADFTDHENAPTVS